MEIGREGVREGNLGEEPQIIIALLLLLYN